MSVKIRLNRIGTHRRPFYRVVATDSRFPQGGRCLEILGTYDPMNYSLPKDSKEKVATGIVNLKTDRIQHWLKTGAECTPVVKSILKRLKISTAKAA